MNKDYRRCIGVSAFSFLVTFGVLILLYFKMSFAPFGQGNVATMDAAIQYLDFFAYLKDVLSGKSDIAYTLSDTLGGDTFSIVSYYLLSPFNLLLIFFEKSQVLTFFNVTFALKVSTAALTMAIFIYKRYNGNLHSIITIALSLSYALMQYSIAQSSNIMWLDGLYMLPLMILGVYYCVYYRKCLLLMISTGLCIIFNWYAAGICCLFSIVYFFYEATILFFEKKASKKERFKKFISHLFCYGFSMIVAVMLSAAVFLPTIYSLLQGKGTNVIVSSDFSGNIISVIENYHINSISMEGSPTIYCGSLALIGCLAFFFSKKIGGIKKAITAISLCFMILIFYYRPLYLVFSLFNYTYSYWYRYGFISVFFVILIAAEYFNKFDGSEKQTILYSSTGFSGLLLLLHYLNNEIDLQYTYLTVFFIMCIGCILCCRKKKKMQNMAFLILIVVLLTELTINAEYLFLNHYSTYEGRVVKYIKNQEKQIKSLKKYDNSDYRISQNAYRREAAYNESLAYGFASNTGYTSCPENLQLEFLDRLGYRAEGDCITVAKDTVLAADAILGVKYVLSTKEIPGLDVVEELPKRNKKQVYVNPYALSLASVVSDFQEDTSIYTNPFEYHSLIFSQLTNDTIDLYEPISYKEEKIDGAIKYTLDLPDGNYIYYGNCPINYDSECYININGQHDLEYGAWLSQSVFMIPQQEIATVTVYEKDENGLGEPQFYALNLDELKRAVDCINRGTSTLHMDGANVSCVVNASSGERLFVSIPYSEGWTIRNNGEIVTPQLLGDCFMMIPLTDGKNDIVMKYSIPYLHEGIIITSIALAIIFFYLIILFFKRGRKKKSLKKQQVLKKRCTCDKINKL